MKVTNVMESGAGLLHFDTRVQHASGWEIPVRVRVRLSSHGYDGMDAEVASVLSLGFAVSEPETDRPYEIAAGVEISDGIDEAARHELEDAAIREWCREEEPAAVDMRRGA